MNAILFDIDGTLLKSEGAARPFFEKAVLEATGLIVDLSSIDWFGRTDYDICSTVLEKSGFTGDLTSVMPVIFELFSVYFEEFVRDNGKKFLAIPYAADLLKALVRDGLERADIGLLTGNVMRNAYIKLESAGLAGYFPYGVGGFGNEARNRNDLCRIAINKMKKHYITGEYNKIFIIGDSPRDIECAKVNGALSLAVATGKMPYDELKKFRPDYVLEDFRNIENILGILV